MPSRWSILLGSLGLITVLVVLPPPGVVLGPERIAPGPEVFQRLEERLMTAIQQHDPAALDLLLADEYELTSPDVAGQRLDKIGYLRGAIDAPERIETFLITRLTSTTFGADLALVRAEVEWTAAAAAGRTRRRTLVTDFWQFRSGRWKLLHRHSTPAE